MALNIHENCKQRLKQILLECLPSVVVKNKTFVDPMSTTALIPADSALPHTGDLHDRLDKYVGDRPVQEFVFEQLSRELDELGRYEENTTDENLTDLSQYADIEQTATRLIESLDSLPWNYTTTVALPLDFGTLFGSHLNSFSFSSNLRIVIADEGFEERFPMSLNLKKGRQLLSTLRGDPTKWEKNHAYLQMSNEGFVGYYGLTPPVADAICHLKAVCGLGIALGLFQIRPLYRRSFIKTKLIVHRQNDDSWAFERFVEMDTAPSEVLADLFLTQLDGRLDSEEKKLDWMQQKLTQMRTVFASGPKGERISLGAQWLFDSSSGQNEFLSFIQAAVVMEILLGEKTATDLVGLGELLSNRCAYLIGKSRSDRDQILKDFRDIYAVRSQIVHSGKNRLDADEGKLFYKLRWLCQRVIFEEIQLLEKDQK
jgi:hypothetical protein